MQPFAKTRASSPKMHGRVGALLHPGQCNALQSCVHHPKTCIRGWESSCSQVDATLCKNACIAPKNCGRRGESPPVPGSMQCFAKTQASPPKSAWGGRVSALLQLGRCNPLQNGMHSSPQPHQRWERSCAGVDANLCKNACIAPQKLHGRAGVLLQPG